MCQCTCVCVLKVNEKQMSKNLYFYIGSFRTLQPVFLILFICFLSSGSPLSLFRIFSSFEIFLDVNYRIFSTLPNRDTFIIFSLD